MAIEIPSPLIEFILLGPLDDRRQLQDSPILGDVWIEFGKRPDDRIDLLIAPYRGQHAGIVATIIDKEIHPRSDDENATDDEDATDEASIAFLQGIIAAKLTFKELMLYVAPKTKWWQTTRTTDEQSKSPLDRQTPQTSVAAVLHYPGDVRKMLDRVLEAATKWHKKTGKRELHDLLAIERFLAVTALILWAGAYPQPDEEGRTRSSDEQIKDVLERATADLEGDKQFARISGFWHNSFEDIIKGDVPTEVKTTFTNKFGPASMDGKVPEDLTLDVDEDEEVIVSSLKILASVKQGAELRGRIINKLQAELNADFGGEPIVAEAGAEPIEIDDDLKFTVAGPMQKELDALRKKHEQWFESLKKAGKSPEDVLSAYADKSVANLSSIVVLAESGDKSILLTGDARGDKILAGLELVGALDPGGTREVDVLKVPHHGSANNLTQNFFERITAKHYVFSGNGEHGNPERETMEMLRNARSDESYEIHLTYPFKEIDVARKVDWEKEQKKESKRKLTKPQTEVRPDWSHEENSLEVFFNKYQSFAAKLRIVEEGVRHVIDLHDEVEV